VKRKIRPNLTFFVSGAIMWTWGGFIIAITCFRPIIPLQILKENKELANQLAISLRLIILKTVLVWTLGGGILGIIISKLFLSRPDYEHFSPTPNVFKYLFLPGIPEISPKPRWLTGPKTRAEINAGFQGQILGIIFGICGTIFFLPLFQNELIVVRELPLRIILGAIQSLLSSTLILPDSLDKLTKKIRERKYEEGY